MKLERAREHLATLDVSLNTIYTLAGPNQIPLTDGFDARGQAWVVRVGDFQPPAVTVASTHIGDIVHNLRGALDHLVWDLAVLSCGQWPLDRSGREWHTQFPICRDKDAFDSRRVQSTQLGPLTPERRTAIEGFQPYVSSDDTLTRLADMSNADKHRAVKEVFLISHAAQPRIRGSRNCEVVGGTGSRPILQAGLEPNTEILRLPLINVGSDPHVDVGFEVVIGVGFRDGASVTGTLTHSGEVVEEILTAFEPELSSPEALRIRESADRDHQTRHPHDRVTG